MHDDAFWRLRRDLHHLSFLVNDLRCHILERRFLAELKANFNTAQPRAPRGTSTGGQWIDADGGADRLSEPRYIPAQGGGRRGGRSGPPTEPNAAFRTERFNATLREIERLDPHNRELNYVAGPNAAPSNRTVNRAVEELEAVRDRASARIGEHAYAQGHGGRYFGGASAFELGAMARRTISDPRSVRVELPRGRTGYYDRASNAVVIVEPEVTGGTIIRRPDGLRYLQDLRKR